MAMREPPHPGEHVREDYLAPLALTVTDAAMALGVARRTLNNLVNEHRRISPEMAIRLEKAFGTSAEVWMRMQANYDLARARRTADQIKVTRFERT